MTTTATSKKKLKGQSGVARLNSDAVETVFSFLVVSRK